MLTRTERRQAKEAVEAKLDQLRAVVEFHLGEEGWRFSAALFQIESMRKWLTRQIEEAGGSG
jgi:hypothetical protein